MCNEVGGADVGFTLETVFHYGYIFMAKHNVAWRGVMIACPSRPHARCPFSPRASSSGALSSHIAELWQQRWTPMHFALRALRFSTGLLCNAERVAMLRGAGNFRSKKRIRTKSAKRRI